MTFILLLIAAGIGALAICEILYIVVMGLERARDEGKLSPACVKAGMAFMYASLLWDVLCNLFVVSFVFLELPREATVSQRLRRLVQQTPGWRRSLATWFAVNLLNPFSNGGPHITLT